MAYTTIWSGTITNEATGAYNCTVRNCHKIQESGTIPSLGKVKVTLTAGASGSTVIGSVWIAHSDAGSGSTEIYFLDPPGQLKFSGNAGVTIPAGQSVTSDELVWRWKPGKDIVTSIYIGNGGSGLFPYYTATGIADWFTNGGGTGDIADDPGNVGALGSHFDQICLVSKIEVDGDAPTSITHLQGQGSQLSTTGTTRAVTLPYPVSVGSTIVGAVCYGTRANTVTSVTDDKGNVYNLETRIDDDANTNSMVAFSLGNITNSPQTITANFSVSTVGRSIMADEFACVRTDADPRDGSAHGGQHQHTSAGTGTDVITSGSFTTNLPGDLIYGITGNGSGDDAYLGIAAGTGFQSTLTRSPISGNQCVMLKSEWQVQSAPGSIAATFTNTVAQSRMTAMFAIKPPIGGTPGKAIHLKDSWA